MKNLYEVSQVLTTTKWIRVEAENEEDAKELAFHENFWNETDETAEDDMQVEFIQELTA